MIADCARSPQQRSPQDAGPIAAAQAWPGKDVVAIVREGIEHREAAVHGGAYLHAEAAAEAPAQRRAREQQRAAAVYLFVYQRAQNGAVGACLHLCLVVAVGRGGGGRRGGAGGGRAGRGGGRPGGGEGRGGAD